MQIEKIKQSIEIVSSYNNHYEVNFTVLENDFTLQGWGESQTCDELELEGVVISIENLTDMYFVIDGAFKSLISIIEAIEVDIQNKADIYDAETEQEEIDEQRMREELSSPNLSGRGI